MDMQGNQAKGKRCVMGRKMIYLDDAIDALDVLRQEHRYKIPGKRDTYSQYNEAWQDALDRVEGTIFNLPSAQPDVPDTNVGDMISRADAIDDLHGKDPSQIWDTADIEVWVNALPSAQTEIDVQKLLKAVYDHPLLGEYEKAVITEIVDKLQEEKADD